MKLSDLGEFAFIDRIARRYPARQSCVLKGIGDDAAVITFPNNSVILLSTDQLIEGFHFRLDMTNGWELGIGGLAVPLCDALLRVHDRQQRKLRRAGASLPADES